jgi:hypothetical protein
MITSTHVSVYSNNVDADRAFFRDVLDCPHVDAGGGELGRYEPRHPRATEL